MKNILKRLISFEAAVLGAFGILFALSCTKAQRQPSSFSAKYNDTPMERALELDAQGFLKTCSACECMSEATKYIQFGIHREINQDHSGARSQFGRRLAQPSGYGYAGYLFTHFPYSYGYGYGYGDGYRPGASPYAPRLFDGYGYGYGGYGYDHSYTMVSQESVFQRLQKMEKEIETMKCKHEAEVKAYKETIRMLIRELKK